VLGTSVGLIFIALAVQFQNAIKPFLVFGAIPYGMVGAIIALGIMGAPFGFMDRCGSRSAMPRSAGSRWLR